ncbi:MAG: Coenzyme F420 hydrogenase/dehydrogenase, beta subunit C-terminal domain [Saccharofermentans sp.]|nr:Coenzyme F420 hydrogenase/dehydrogenase, beta subunit C-terminal domain [Saccharofermentans sp.]
MQQIVENRSKCFGCEACSYSCPAGAVSMVSDKEGFYYPAIEQEKCIDCGMCQSVCPSLNPDVFDAEASFYAVRVKDQVLLQKSTSGGAFSLIAGEILNKGGLICGAVYDEDHTVRHILADDITPMRKSKYVQSSLGDVFGKIKEAIDTGRTVLFTGTPCQCHAVKKLIGDSGNLWLASIICRGVQSPVYWQEYCRFLEARHNGNLTYYCAREKIKTDDAHTVLYTVGQETYKTDYMKDPFCRIYSKELSLRPSCYSCPYTTAVKDFDFTIGDYWGVEKEYPDLADGKGTSLVICGSERAEELLRRCSGDADIRSADPDNSMQPALVSPAKEGFLRKFLMKDFASKGDNGDSDIATILKKYGV